MISEEFARCCEQRTCWACNFLNTLGFLHPRGFRTTVPNCSAPETRPLEQWQRAHLNEMGLPLDTAVNCPSFVLRDRLPEENGNSYLDEVRSRADVLHEGELREQMTGWNETHREVLLTLLLEDVPTLLRMLHEEPS